MRSLTELDVRLSAYGMLVDCVVRALAEHDPELTKSILGHAANAYQDQELPRAGQEVAQLVDENGHRVREVFRSLVVDISRVAGDPH